MDPPAGADCPGKAFRSAAAMSPRQAPDNFRNSLRFDGMFDSSSGISGRDRDRTRAET